MRSATPIVLDAAAARWHGVRERLNVAAPMLERLLAGGYAAMLLAFFVIRDHDFLRHWSYVTVVAPFLLIARHEEWRVLVRSPVLIASAAYLGYLWCSVWWSVGASGADALLLLRDALAILAFLGTTVLLALRRPTFFRHLFLGLSVVATVSAVIAIVLYLTDDSVPPLDRAYGFGLGGFPTRAAMLYGAVGIIALYAGLAGATTTPQRVVFTAGLVASVAFLVFAQARGAMVGFAATVALGGLLMRQKLIVLGIPLAIATYVVAQLSGAMEAYDLLSRGTTQRTIIWDLALDRAAAAPWLGYGIGDTQSFLLWGGDLLIPHPHSLWLSHQLVGGLVAVTLLLILLSLWLVTALRVFHHERDYLLLALLVFVVVCGLVDLQIFLEPLDIDWLYVWLPVGLAAAAFARNAGSERGACWSGRPSRALWLERH